MDELKVRAIAREEAEDVCNNHMQICDAWRQISVNPYGHQDDHGWVGWVRKNIGEVLTGLFKKFVLALIALAGFVGYYILRMK